MKIFLAFFVAMGTIVTLGDAACFTVFRKPGWPHKGCIMDGKIYPFGRIERTEMCDTCYCKKYALQCCSYSLYPQHYNKEKCKVIFDRKRCHSVVVQKDDPSKFCSFGLAG